MIQGWEKEEYEEIIGQGAKLILMVGNDPIDAELWAKLKAWATDNKNYIGDGYTPPEEKKGYDISQLDGNPDNLNF